MNPKFIIFTGPMFGSKTTRLFAVLDRYKYQKRKIVAFKPSIDNRYSETNITTHSGASMPARVVKNGMEIHQYISHHNEYDVIAVDEAFMIPDISDALMPIFNCGTNIIISSLDLSSSLRSFKEVEKMLPWATKIEKCPAVCTSCSRDAYYTYRKVDDSAEIIIGGSDLYEPRCWEHHDLFKNIEER